MCVMSPGLLYDDSKLNLEKPLSRSAVSPAGKITHLRGLSVWDIRWKHWCFNRIESATLAVTRPGWQQLLLGSGFPGLPGFLHKLCHRNFHAHLALRFTHDSACFCTDRKRSQLHGSRAMGGSYTQSSRINHNNRTAGRSHEEAEAPALTGAFFRTGTALNGVDLVILWLIWAQAANWKSIDVCRRRLADNWELTGCSVCSGARRTAKSWPLSFSQEELKKRLTPLQYHVTQERGTERFCSFALPLMQSVWEKPDFSTIFCLFYW